MDNQPPSQPPPQRPPNNGLLELYKNPIVQELVVPILQRRFLGVEKNDTAATKKPFGRAIYAIRDFIQGTYWIVIITGFSFMIILVTYRILMKWFGL